MRRQPGTHEPMKGSFGKLENDIYDYIVKQLEGDDPESKLARVNDADFHTIDVQEMATEIMNDVVKTIVKPFYEYRLSFIIRADAEGTIFGSDDE